MKPKRLAKGARPFARSVPPPRNGTTARDAKGRFGPGNSAASGPHRTRGRDLRAAFASAVTEENMRALARRLYRRALNGDDRAARLVLAYAVGPATTPMEGEDGYDPQEEFL